MSGVLRAPATDQHILKTCERQLQSSRALPVLMATQTTIPDAQLVPWLAMIRDNNGLRRQLLSSVVRVVILGACVALSGGLPVNTVLWVLLTVALVQLVSVLVHQA